MTLSDEASVSSSSSQGIVADVTNQRMNLRELKKELKGIDKLTKKNLDIKSWKSDLNLWIKYQHIKDPETIFTACILTSSGEIREIIQDLYYENSFTIKEEDEENDEQEYPSLDDMIAEKVDRLIARSTYNYYGTFDSNASTRISKSYPNNNTQFKRKTEYSESQKVKDSEMEDLTRKMKNLSVKVCFFCTEKSHVQFKCPKLQEILMNSCNEMFKQ
eukprot:jgi/Orpsp1_1/1190087/evm.model.d7180000076501.1